MKQYKHYTLCLSYFLIDDEPNLQGIFMNEAFFLFAKDCISMVLAHFYSQISIKTEYALIYS